MSASISGGFPLRSASSLSGGGGSASKRDGTATGRRRPSVTSGLSLSSPDVPQLHSMPTRNESPETHPPAATVPQPHQHHHHHGISLHPLTPLNGPGGTSSSHSSSSSNGQQPSVPGTSYSTLSGPGPSASSLSLTSIDSASTSFTTATGVSRASSTRSTSSVQAVPMRKPQRTPAVPRIVTRGINALSAYGVGMTSAGAGGATAPLSPTWESGGGGSSKGKTVVGSSPADFPSISASQALVSEDDDATPPASTATASRPSVLQRSSWRRRVGSNNASAGSLADLRAQQQQQQQQSYSSGQPSPVQESSGGSAPSSPVLVGSGDLAPLEPWRVLERPGDEAGSPLATQRIGSSSTSRTRRATPDASARRTSAAVPESPRSPTGTWERPRYSRAESSKLDDSPRLRLQQQQQNERDSSSSPARTVGPRGAAAGRPHGYGHERDVSHASRSSATSTLTPTSPTMARSRERERELIGMVPNAMGVVGNRRSTEDFEFGDVLGEGSYSTVTLVTTVHPPYRQYALKVLDKEHIKRERKTKYVLIERDTLKALDGHPGIIKLWWTFQDEWSLYYVLEYAENGELLKWIKKFGSFDLRSARYYTAQILSAVEYMHEKGVIHRDLKPENILLDRNMRVKITDFGTAKLLKQDEIKNGQPLDEPQGRPRARSFVGTPEYVSPEILSEGRESSFSSDFWALGCVLYQILAGRPPFQARTEYLMFQKIINLQYDFPPGFPHHARDLVEKLLVVDPLARLGGDPANGNGIEALKSHPFFTERLRPDLPHESALAAEDETVLPSPVLFTPPARGSPPSTSPDSTSEPLSSSLSELKLGTPLPRSRTPSRSSLDDPVDWVKIWEVEPPPIETGLCPPVPVVTGQFVLLDDGQSSIAPSTTETGLTGAHLDSQVVADEETRSQRSLSMRAAGAEMDPGIDEEEGYEDEEDEDLDDLEAVAGSPTSTNGRDLPPASTFGAGKWSDVLLPSETIIMLSPILQRPSSSAAAARTAILGRGQRMKLNPLNFISSTSLAAAASPSGSPQSLNAPLPGTSPASSVSMSASSTSTGFTTSTTLTGGSISPLPSPPLAPTTPGSKPRTLILTDYPRLLCIKETPDRISIKSEVFLGGSAKTAPRREGISTFVSVEPSSKDVNGFTVKTTTRSFKYEEPFGHAARWIRELREAHQAALVAPQPPRR
ncbi:hypothetical protein JCM10908_000786 [Rhodotorula pacifica]|uniref:PDK1 family serine/threonine-protein kinase n=1 Tax=Rhodotorula pacifica TaxID=1495444 RepID=UPI00317C549B